jgi:type II secretory pathway pseudopilin PulG
VRRIDADAAGFSLIEIIIAMFLLMVIALALLPALIGATRVSVVNRSLVEATAFANAQLAPIRAAFPDNSSSPTSCGTLTAKNGSVNPDQPSPKTRLFAKIVVGACPSAYPGTVAVTVIVYDKDPLKPIVTLPTKVLVGKP